MNLTSNELGAGFKKLQPLMMNCHRELDKKNQECYGIIFVDKNKKFHLEMLGRAPSSSFNADEFRNKFKKNSRYQRFKDMAPVADFHNHPYGDSAMCLSWGDVGAWLCDDKIPTFKCVSGNMPYGVGCYVLKKNPEAQRLQKRMKELVYCDRNTTKVEDEKAEKFYNKHWSQMINTFWYNYKPLDIWPQEPYTGWKLLKWKGKEWFDSRQKAIEAAKEYYQKTGNKNIMFYNFGGRIKEHYIYVKEKK